MDSRTDRSKKFLVGIDGGSQSTKVTMFDLNGNPVCQGRASLRPCISVKTGYSEHPDDDLWDAFLAACREMMQQFTGRPEDILGIGLCTIRSCRVFLREDGSLAQPVMSWLDSRAFGPIDAGDAVKYVTTTTGYFTYRLTGNFRDTAANNTEGQWPIDPYVWDWSDDPQKYIRFHISRSMLLPLELPGSILGLLTPQAAQQTGFPMGIPVVATANDKAVEALGAGLTVGDKGLISLGTYITSMIGGTEYLDGNDKFFCNFASIPNQYLYESNGIWRGMWTISWLMDLLKPSNQTDNDIEGGILPEDILNQEAAAIPPGSEGLMTVMEWLSPEPHKKGMMIGFDVRHTRAHIYRSMAEGIAMTMLNHFNAMCRAANALPKALIISGGGANSDLFMQIFADVFGMPAARNSITSSAGLGAAICAAVAVGVYSSFQEAAANMVHARDTFQPNLENHAFYKTLNQEVYAKLSLQMDPLLLRLQALLDTGET